MKTLALVIAFVAAGYLLGAWLLMLFVGMVHADWLHSMPTMSWHAALVLVVPLTILLGSGAAAKANSAR